MPEICDPVKSYACVWGCMSAEGGDDIATAWWVSCCPGLAMLVTVLSLNLFGA